MTISYSPSELRLLRVITSSASTSNYHYGTLQTSYLFGSSHFLDKFCFFITFFS
jgi:hypothetical protein